MSRLAALVVVLVLLVACGGGERETSVGADSGAARDLPISTVVPDDDGTTTTGPDDAAGDDGDAGDGSTTTTTRRRQPTTSTTAGNPDQPVSTTPDTSTAEPGTTWSRVTPRAGQIDPRPIGWVEWKPIDDDTVELHFWGGVEPCFVVDRVDVKRSASSVTLTIYAGHAPGAESATCIEIAKAYAVVVDLGAELAGRTVVDGAD